MPISEGWRALEPLPIQEQQSETTGGVPNVPRDPWQSEVEEVWLPFALTDSQRRWLEERLPHLPPLRYPMSDEEVAAFLDAYRRLEKQHAWEPVLLTAADIERRKADQAMVLMRHRKKLQAEFSGGRVVAVDDRHLPVPVLTMGSFIPREQAIAYLGRCGLAHDGSDLEPDVRYAQQLMESGGEGVSATMSPTIQPSSKDEPIGKASRRRRPESNGGSSLPAELCPVAVIRPVGKVARLPRVMELTGLGRSSIYNRMDPRSAQYDPTFPHSFSLGASGSAVGWDEELVKAWVAARAASG